MAQKYKFTDARLNMSVESNDMPSIININELCEVSNCIPFLMRGRVWTMFSWIRGGKMDRLDVYEFGS